MLTQIKKFFALEWRDKKNLIRAYFLLGIMRAAILSLTFKRLSRSLEHHPDEISHKPLDNPQLTQAKAIGWAVTTAASYTPWDSNCLAQALTAQRMLQQQQIAGMFFLGVKKENKQLEAHAWLQCDEAILTGKAGHEDYSVVSTFSWL